MNIFITSDPTLLILLILMGILSLVLLVALAVAWSHLPQQYRKRNDWDVTYIVDREWGKVAKYAPAWFEVDEA